MWSQEKGKAKIIRYILLLYLNVFFTFSLLYLLLDIFQLGPLVSLNEEQYLFKHKLSNSLVLSATALLSESNSTVIPTGWSRGIVFIEETVGFLIPVYIILFFLPLDHVRFNRTKETLVKLALRTIFVTLGALFVSVGLMTFLIPNKIIDGGIVGISIMLSYLTGFKLELLLLILNIPFLYLGYRKIGKKFVVTTILGISVLSIGTYLLNNVPVPTDSPIIASLSGGAFLGVGVGMVIRYGGSLDGTEILGILLNKRTSFSVGKFVMIINIFIFSSAGIIFGWDRSLYSIITYYIASIMIDIVIEGFLQKPKNKL